jgi:G protein-coupled receptor Mth (Methuselah protein)
LYLKIFLLGGITWIFEVLSFIFNNHKPSAWLWDICDLFNCLHGVLIFIILIIWRQRIRKELAGKRILGFTCPSTWADIYNEEEMCLEGDGKTKYKIM